MDLNLTVQSVKMLKAVHDSEQLRDRVHDYPAVPSFAQIGTSAPNGVSASSCATTPIARTRVIAQPVTFSTGAINVAPRISPCWNCCSLRIVRSGD